MNEYDDRLDVITLIITMHYMYTKTYRNRFLWCKLLFADLFIFLYLDAAPLAAAAVQGSDIDVEGTWIFDDGQTLAYTNWALSQPSGGTVQNVYFVTNTMEWHAASAAAPAQFLCEKCVRC